MRLALELGRSNIGDPDLDRPKALSAETATVLPNPLPDTGVLMRCSHRAMLHVTLGCVTLPWSSRTDCRISSCPSEDLFAEPLDRFEITGRPARRLRIPSRDLWWVVSPREERAGPSSQSNESLSVSELDAWGLDLCATLDRR